MVFEGLYGSLGVAGLSELLSSFTITEDLQGHWESLRVFPSSDRFELKDLSFLFHYNFWVFQGR